MRRRRNLFFIFAFCVLSFTFFGLRTDAEHYSVHQVSPGTNDYHIFISETTFNGVRYAYFQDHNITRSGDVMTFNSWRVRSGTSSYPDATYGQAYIFNSTGSVPIYEFWGAPLGASRIWTGSITLTSSVGDNPVAEVGIYFGPSITDVTFDYVVFQ